MGQAPLALTGQAGQSLDALLAGEGLDQHSSSDLLVGWLTPDGPSDPSGAVILDDAGEMDADTLETVVYALRAGGTPFRVIARLGNGEPLPPALAPIPCDATIRLARLSDDDAIALGRACAGGISEDALMQWAPRGGGLPLAIVESLREGLEAETRESGDGDGGGDSARATAPCARPPKHWVRQRLLRLEGESRRVLEALSILGGQAEAIDLADTLRGWVQRMKPDVIALSTATHRDAILSTLTDLEFQAWHRAASEAFARRERPLSMAAATVHAVLAGDAEPARELARLAAAATKAMGLGRTVAAFERLAEHGDVAALASRSLFTSQLELSRAAPSVWPAVASPDPGARSSASASPSSVRPAVVASPAVAALRNGDLEAVERMAEQACLDQGRIGLGERLRAMAHLARGETGDAIRRLRDAAELARRTGSRDRCRTALALAVALSAGSRHEEALLEALDALARAREADDMRGEHASLRFLSQLSRRVGRADVAERWAAAER